MLQSPVMTMTYSVKLKLILLISICLICCTISLLVGDLGLDWHPLTAFGQDALQKTILLQIRLPHTLNAFAIGGLLALAGLLMQGMLANPLVDPYTLGTSGGAAVFTLLGMMLGFQGMPLVGLSFLGALATLSLLRLLLGQISQVPTSKLLLVGVVMAAGWGALLSLLLILAPDLQTKSLLYWLFGDVDYLHYPLFALGSLVFAGIVSYLIADDLHLLSQGSILAKTLGVNTGQLQYFILILSSFITATAVSVGGTIGFLGLIVPHCARFMLQRQSRLIIPFTIILGSTLLLLADIVARIAIAPEQLPIGLITSLVGIPSFLYLVKKHYG
jgi:iron complex transport system permease protein